MTKELLFSVTAKDCEFTFTRGTGKGGQKKNKTSSACYCKHRDSGAQGYAEDSRQQSENKVLAFGRMVRTERFTNWHKLETAKRMGVITQVEDYIEHTMHDNNIRTETKIDGKWTETRESDLND